MGIRLLVLDSPCDDNFTKNQSVLPTNHPSLVVDVFGESHGKSIDEGFVFIDGKYIEAPYFVSRMGLGIFINNILAVKPVPWSPNNTNDTVILEPPKIPPNISTNSSFEEIRGYLSSNYHFLVRHHSDDDLVNEMIKSLRVLPCTRDVEKLNNLRVKLTLFSGETTTINMRRFGKGPKLPQDVTSVKQRVEKKRENLEGELRDGFCYFLFSNGGEVQFSTKADTQRLPFLIGILGSTNSEAVKTEQLKKSGFPYFTTDPYKTSMMNFLASKQLHERIKALTKTNNWITSQQSTNTFESKCQDGRQ